MAEVPPLLDPAARVASAGVWALADDVLVERFHEKSSPHRPVTHVRLLHDDQALHVWFTVQDRYVRCVNDQLQSRVSQDSCVEAFIQPFGASGYLNFEVNCGGAMLLYFIRDARRGADDRLFRDYDVLPVELLRTVSIRHSMPSRVDPEIAEPVSWQVELTIPAALFDHVSPGAWSRRAKPWRANFFKCGDHTSHPHWASWADIGPELRFHQPARFGWLQFEG